MIAAEEFIKRAIARLMDGMEVGARRIFKPLGKKFVRLPALAQLSISLMIAGSTFGLMCTLYSLALGG
jgi:hypothetical protein